VQEKNLVQRKQQIGLTLRLRIVAVVRHCSPLAYAAVMLALMADRLSMPGSARQ